MRGLFLDANPEMQAVFDRVRRPEDPEIDINLQDDVAPADIPRLLAGYRPDRAAN